MDLKLQAYINQLQGLGVPAPGPQAAIPKGQKGIGIKPELCPVPHGNIVEIRPGLELISAKKLGKLRLSCIDKAYDR